MDTRKTDYIGPFLAGLGVGVAATVLFTPKSGRQTRDQIGGMASRAGTALKEQAEGLADAASGVFDDAKATWMNASKEGSQRINDLTDTAKQKMNTAADATQKAVNKAVDTSKDVAHTAGKQMQAGGKQLQNM